MTMRNQLSSNILPFAEFKQEGLPSLVVSSFSSSTPSTPSSDSRVFDSGVKEALKSSKRSGTYCGTFSEILKLELKTKIQLRRHKNGKELQFFEEKLSQQSKYELTPADLERRKELRERNKLSARKHRIKRRDEKHRIEKEVRLLLEKNRNLRQKVEELEWVKNKICSVKVV